MESESTNIPQLSRTPIPDLDSDFIDKIIEKTAEGKISWVRTGPGYKGRTPDGNLSMDLAMSSVPIWGMRWNLFAVKRGGEEILKIDNQSSLLLSSLTSGSLSHQKVTSLMNFLEGARLREVKAALSDLERL